jgi:hypothetical protein
MSDSFYKSEMDREMLLNIEIQKQNLKSLPEKFKPQKKTVSPVTQQMIDDYKQQFRDSYKRSKDGTAQFYKFLIPEALPTLEIIDDDLIQKLIEKGEYELIFDDDSITDINDAINEKVTDYKDQEQGLKDQYRIIEESKTRINELTASKIEILRKYRNIDKNKELDTNITNQLAEIDRRIENNLERIKLSEDAIIQINIRLPNIQTEINELKKELEENDENKIKNEKVLYTIEQNNKKKLADYATTLRIMNEGQINIEQEPGESETDFLKRLADVALIEEDLTRASLYNTNEFKKNLKTLIKSDWKIENLVKAFNNDSQFLLNKTFAGFKKHFKNIYGLGNKELDVEEYISIINDYLDSPATSLIKKGDTKRKTEEESYDIPDIEKKKITEDEKDDDDEMVDEGLLPDEEGPGEVPTVDAKEIVRSTTTSLNYENFVLQFDEDGRSIYFILRPAEEGAKLQTIYYTYDLSINYQKISNENQKFSTNLKNILSKNFTNPEVISNNFKNKNNNITASSFIKYFKDYFSKPKEEPKEEPQDGEGLTGKALQGFKKPGKSRKLKKSNKTNKTKKKPVVQKGASVKTVPTHCQFGKTIILLNKLYQNNILSVKDSNNINIQGIPNSKVSDKFVNIILSICNDEEVNKKDIDTLSEKDFILINVLMKKAGLTKKYNIDNTKAIKLLKDRLELVEGEILAGNTNEEIKKELYDIVFKLANIGATNLSSSRKYYKDVVKLMF